ncbi:MAG: SDR family oxidoreductase [Burkholderiales bacterium]|nr:SDR family oxidoreductase [Burkholderiales bacterium]
MNLNLENQHIVVSGGARGIGFAIIKAIADEGGIPIIISRTKEYNEQALDAINNKGYSVECNLSDPNDCIRGAQLIKHKFNSIYAVVNNAGENDSVGLENGNYDEFMQSLHKNLVHYYLLTQAFLPELKASEGVILNIGSKVAATGQGNTSGYAAANGGRNALTREWAAELVKYNIRVNAIIVGDVYTPLYEKWINSLDNPKEAIEKITANIPLGNRMTTPDEIANLAVFLLSNKSNHITGQLIHADGGYTHLDRAITK